MHHISKITIYVNNKTPIKHNVDVLVSDVEQFRFDYARLVRKAKHDKIEIDFDMKEV
jgi:hypothetical protein